MAWTEIKPVSDYAKIIERKRELSIMLVTRRLHMIYRFAKFNDSIIKGSVLDWTLISSEKFNSQTVKAGVVIFIREILF